MVRTLSLAAAFSLCAALPAHAFELREEAPKAPSARLDVAPGELSDGIPLSMKTAFAGDVASELTLNAEAFVRDVEAQDDAAQDALAGGGAHGQAADGNEVLAFILGLIPGFGLGHFLIAGDNAGGMQWLIIDIIFLVVLVVLDVLPWPFWIIADLAWVGWLVEHIFQGLSAFHAAGGRRVFSESAPPPEEPRGPRVAGAGYPNLLNLHF